MLFGAVFELPSGDGSANRSEGGGDEPDPTAVFGDEVGDDDAGEGTGEQIIICHDNAFLPLWGYDNDSG